MQINLGKKLIFIRHAPVVSDGLFYGSRDIECRTPTSAEIENIRELLPGEFNLFVSSAARCVKTASHLFPRVRPLKLDALKEQDFGSWEGVPFEKIPNIGSLSLEELADYRPVEGESFNEMSLRVHVIIDEILEKTDFQETSIIIAHAGTIRAAISKLVGKSALSFQFDNLSLSELIFLNDGMVINYLNRSIIR